ncbi:hypothetical protein ABID99_005702 [Mucilaginibacter sp. OAE612]|uniref:Shedu immune nuclease family protein n=1 Tax=Mucilaginibacter sp. OAE612 TaxID=3156444 RepID=UPI00359E873C
MAEAKGEYLQKELATKKIFFYKDPTEKVDQLSREVYKTKDEEVHYPRGFEKDKPKYRTIRKFIYKGFKGSIPVGVIKAANFGYGFTKTLNPFAFYINDNYEIEEIIIEKDGKVEIDLAGKKLYLSQQTLATLNTVFRNIYSKHRNEVNFILQLSLSEIFPSKVSRPNKTYVPNALASSLASWGNSIEEFSDSDKEAIKDLFDKLSLSTDFLTQESLAKTKEIVDSKYIQKTIKKCEELIALKTDSESLEKQWQGFLHENSWIFSSLFAQPVVLHQREAYVGGKTIENKDGKFNDFLLKSSLSTNVSFVEIKTHKTKLVENSAYRGTDVFSVTKDLSGCVAQVLNQRDNFQKEYYTLKSKSKGEKAVFETLNSKCMVLIGSLGDLSDDQKSSFELFRTNSRDVEILTFDELLTKIKTLQQVISNKS